MSPIFLSSEIKMMLDQLKDGIYIANKSGVTLWINQTSEKQLGVKRKDIIGKTADELEARNLFTPSVTKIVLKKRKTISKAQTSKGIQYLATGSLIEVEETGEEYVIVHVKDISEMVKNAFKLKKAETLMSQYWNELQKMKSEKRDKTGEKRLIGTSDAHNEVMDLLRRVANFDATILLQGETGVGKSVFAKEVHVLSERRNQPFVQVNCGALPANLIESELFGYKKGAFTGANSRGKTGLIEEASGGTLFLDEIGEFPIELQPKLLQFLQDKSFLPIGSTVLQHSDTRIITATNQDLLQLVKEKRFREDLYYRLNVIPIEILSLKERREDILPLAHHFLQTYNYKYQRNVVLPKEVQPFFYRYNWPGNIRELENLIERLVITVRQEKILENDLPYHMLKPNDEPASLGAEEEELQGKSLSEYLDSIERKMILKAYSKYKSTRKMAEKLGLTQSAVVRRMKKYNIS
ncbi:sigma-54 interaction domain-containing protein [Priestia endophytica]|uniref:HTH-type transcriptional regulatory protein TyrR n=1 Tax=Priestia endophytica DSM 13796 TaxID=1121089 RepID=A0A1I6B1T1_9BACI|nr:sigma 54-interacting transcriptional regulator [Priestia endophytica]KYG26874.1 PAS domain S-box protein [Priestia endophytica]MBG9812880.1 hypothetical protein [Priestia endophytica]SFQ74885.1 PAS domain S-box-containing protein/TyrR family helix-turn-helix domain-containing protein [Priestia endophytica DSM 13796]